jgi:hypothetical protein
MGSGVTLYLGAPGAGKSYLMRRHVEALAGLPDAPIFFVVDHGEKPGAESWADLRGADFYSSIPEWWTRPSALAVFRGVEPIDVARLTLDAGFAVYVDDEVDLLLGACPWKASPLRDIVKRGRHARNKAGNVTEVGALIATHRPANLPTDLSGLFSRVYVGRLVSFNDADRVYREGWISAPSVADAKAQLEAFEPGAFSVWPI